MNRKLVGFILITIILALACSPALAESPLQKASLVFEDNPSIILPQADGSLYYVTCSQPAAEQKSNELNQLRYINAAGETIWACDLPAFSMPWSQLYINDAGQVELLAWLQNESLTLMTVSRNGVLVSTLDVKLDLRPVMKAGPLFLGTRQQEELALMRILPDGGVEPFEIPGHPDQAVPWWSMPKKEGAFLLTRSRFREYEGFNSEADYVISWVDHEGRFITSARVDKCRNFSGPAGDALLTSKGGIAVLERKDVPNEAGLLIFDAAGNLLQQASYTLHGHAMRLQLIDPAPEGGYLLYGNGFLDELSQQAFTVRLNVDEKGQLLGVQAKQGHGKLVRYIDNQPYVFFSMAQPSHLTAFEGLEDVKITVTQK